jgi:hypothetical protein
MKPNNNVISNISPSNDITWEALIALILGVAAIFDIQGIVKKQLNKPKLKVDFKLSPPEAIRLTIDQTISFYAFKLKILNNGNYQMEDVEILIEEIYKEERPLTYIKAEDFLPLNLNWLGIDSITMPKIQPQLFKYCELGFMFKKEHIISKNHIPQSIDVVITTHQVIRPNANTYTFYPGRYKLKLIIAANNLVPEHRNIEINFNNSWYDSEEEMFSNIDIKILD